MKKIRKEYFLKIGLTGGIGSGKSLVLNLLNREGVLVLKTDEVARQLLGRHDIQKKILGVYGEGILNDRGQIDRSKLAWAAFKNSIQQGKLNNILHPEVRKIVNDWLRKEDRKKCHWAIKVVEVPLLFENGYYRVFDGVLSISANFKLRERRLLKRGWNRNEIMRRERLQWHQSDKDKMAHWVIFNNGTKGDLQSSVFKWLRKMREAFFMGV